MRKVLYPALVAAILLVGALQVSAGPAPGTVLFSDNFESYTAGANLVGQTGSQWSVDWAAGSKYEKVNTTYSNSTSPIPQLAGSTKYVSAAAYNDKDCSLLDLPYHVGNGSNLTGDFRVDWSFYDPIGSGVLGQGGLLNAANFTDIFSLSNIVGMPTTADPTSASQFPTPWAAGAQRIEVGASPTYSGSWDRTKYQVRCFGYTDGYNGGDWFNTVVNRSIGWHSGSIVVGAPLANGSSLIDIYIDGTLVFDRNSTTTGGFNAIEMLNAYPYYSGAFDNVTITAIPEPSSILALGMGLFGVLGMIKRRK